MRSPPLLGLLGTASDIRREGTGVRRGGSWAYGFQFVGAFEGSRVGARTACKPAGGKFGGPPFTKNDR